MEEWDVNEMPALRTCCCLEVCKSCEKKIWPMKAPCPLCRMPAPKSESEELARLRRHAENDIPEALKDLADIYRRGGFGLKVSLKKCAKLYKRAVEPVSYTHLTLPTKRIV